MNLHEHVEDEMYFSSITGIARVKDPLHGMPNKAFHLAAHCLPQLGIELTCDAQGIPNAWLALLRFILTDGAERIETAADKVLRSRWAGKYYRVAIRTFPLSRAPDFSEHSRICILSPKGRRLEDLPLLPLLNARPPVRP